MTDGNRVQGGLRERRRADTRLRIERAALSAVLRDGFDGATIDGVFGVSVL